MVVEKWSGKSLISKYYAKIENENVSKILKLGIITCLCLAGIIIVTVNIFAAPIANVFNSEHIAALTDYAVKGLRIYFIGFIFAGLNIFLSLAFSSMSKAAPAFIISIMRGFVVIIASVFLLSYLFKMTGVWLAFPVASCHVSRDGYRILLSSVCNYLSLKLVELGIEHLVRYLSLGQHMTEFL